MVDGDALIKVEGNVEDEGCELGIFLGMVNGNALENIEEDAMGEVEYNVGGEVNGRAIELLLELVDVLGNGLVRMPTLS